jgi:uncharacterized Zn-binding protein involved in type VI secretion
MQPTAKFSSQCSATFSPYGRCVSVAYGRIIDSANQTYVNGLAIATVGAQIAYSGWIYPDTGGGPTYVSWIGRVLASSSNVFHEGQLVATIGTPTDSGGYVISGDETVYA